MPSIRRTRSEHQTRRRGFVSRAISQTAGALRPELLRPAGRRGTGLGSGRNHVAVNRHASGIRCIHVGSEVVSGGESRRPW